MESLEKILANLTLEMPLNKLYKCKKGKQSKKIYY